MYFGIYLTNHVKNDYLQFFRKPRSFNIPRSEVFVLVEYFKTLCAHTVSVNSSLLLLEMFLTL